MTSSIESALQPLESNDSFLCSAFEAIVPMMAGTEAAKQLDRTQLYLVDYRKAGSDVLNSNYYTDNCCAILDEQAIVVNEGYLLETEAAVRSFELAGDLLSVPYLRSDEDLFGLVDRIRDNTGGYLNRLRSLDHLPGRETAGAEAVESFAMLMVFLIGHELGHLAGGQNQRAFGGFVSLDAPLTTHIGNAVVKLARQARDLARLGFDLPGMEQLIDESSEIGNNEKAWREALHDIQFNHEKWFADESSADDFAVALVQQVLDRVAAKDSARADRLLGSLVNALFAAAMYHWQRDLGVFLEKLGLARLSNAGDLAFIMMQDRKRYINAAELFGEVHRFTLLRAIMAIDRWLNARGVLRQDLDHPVRRIEPVLERPEMEPKIASQCWQREMLLCIHVDTAVKIATVGSATGWLLEADKARGYPQLFFMNFESISDSVKRLQHMR